MFDFDTIASFVLVLAIASVFLMVILLRQKRTGKDIAIWLSAGAAGVLIGGAASAAAVLGMGYIVVPKPQDGYEIGGGSLAPVPPSNPAGPQMISPMPVGAGGPGGGGPGGGGPGMGMMGGGMMGGGMGGGGGRGPSPKRQLTTLVRKLDLLTGDIAIRLTDEQTAAFKTALAELAAKETLTDEEATEQYDKLLGLLDDAQKAKQDAIGLPFRRGGGPGGPGGGGPGGPGGPGPGGPGGGPAGPGGPGAGGPGGGGPGGGGPGGGGGPPAPDANPFSDEENGKSLKELLDRVSGS